ncbi:hypothetical protein F2P56_014970, partial [Juglans regia]
MVFSNNVRREVQAILKQLWGNSEIQQYERYLGLPPMVGRSRHRAFISIKQRVRQKLQSWKEQLLSIGGKEILLKAVAQSIPMYAMSCFLLPSTLCSDLEGLMAKFWSGQKGVERKIHWLSWPKMCEPKAGGGLGFKDLRTFNLAPLAKEGWRLLQNEGSLLFRLFKARYFPNSAFAQAGLGHSPSFTWRGIWEAKKWVLRGSRWRVGDGRTVKVWFDQWVLGHGALCSEMSHGSLEVQEDVVASLMDVDAGNWNVHKLRSLFNPNVVSDILKIV